MDNIFCLNVFIHVRFPILRKTIQIYLFLNILNMDIYITSSQHYLCNSPVHRSAVLVNERLAFQLQLCVGGVSE